MQDTHPDIVSQMYRSEVFAPGYKFDIYYAEKLNGETVEVLHSHHNFEIYYALENRIVSRIEDGEHVLEKGNALFLAPGVLHHTVYEPNVSKDYFVLIFDVVPSHPLDKLPDEHRTQYLEVKERLDMILEQRFLIARGAPDMALILERIRQEKINRYINWMSLLNSYLHHFFIHAIREVGVESSHSTVEEPQEKLNLGVDATKFMHANYHRDISLEDAAEYLNISPRHVNRVFRDVFGSTFSKTLSLFRLNYAKKYLASTGDSVEKISEKVGFKTPRTLFKLFSQYEKMSAAEYRKKYQAKAKK